VGRCVRMRSRVESTGAPDDVTHSQVIKRAITSVVVRLSLVVSGNK